jgi:hypothetical protein
MKNFLFLMIAAAAMVFAGCSKDDDNGNGDNNGISFNVVGLASSQVSSPYQIDTVKVEIEKDYDYVYTAEMVLATAIYANGGFTINLPATVNDLYLHTASEWFDDELAGGSVTVSNHSVKINTVELDAYKADGDYRDKVGGFYLAATGGWEGLLIYVTGHINIAGTYFDKEEYEDYGKAITTTYSLNLKQGWNIIYEKTERNAEKTIYTVTQTTTAPAGAKWEYYESERYGDYISGGGK